MYYLKNHKSLGVNVEDIHVLGYSVGAHIAGLIANYLPEDKLGRITGNIFFLFITCRKLHLTSCYFYLLLRRKKNIIDNYGH